MLYSWVTMTEHGSDDDGPLVVDISTADVAHCSTRCRDERESVVVRPIYLSLIFCRVYARQIIIRFINSPYNFHQHYYYRVPR